MRVSAGVSFNFPGPKLLLGKKGDVTWRARGVEVRRRVSTREMSALEAEVRAEAPRPVDQFIDEKVLLEESTFPIKPDALIELTKKAIADPKKNFTTDVTLVDPECFVFKAPFIGPLTYEQMTSALKNFALDVGFPVYFSCFHNFWVDPYEPSRVWYTQRYYGKNTGPILGKPPTNLIVDGTPCMHSFVFNEEGKIVKCTIGYPMDRDIGNTGGMGGVFGILYAIGSPLPFPEANPYKPSFGFRLVITLLLTTALSSIQGAAAVNIADFAESFGSADADALQKEVQELQSFESIHLTAKEIWLKQTLTVDVSHVAIFGAPGGTRLRCPPQSGGGCIVKGTNVTIEGIEFVGCNGQVAVTAKQNSRESPHLGVTLRNVTFSENAQTDEGAAAVFEGCEMLDCSGGLLLVTLENCLFKENQANRGGGALLLRSCEVTIRGTTFLGNKAQDGRGGAIWARRSRLKIVDSQFVENVAHVEGGAICVQEPGSTLSVSGSTFEKNSAYNAEGVSLVEKDVGKGGAVSMHRISTFSFKNCFFEENKGLMGGALSLDLVGSSVASSESAAPSSFSNCEFIRNTASVLGDQEAALGQGGAIHLAVIQGEIEIHLSETTFKFNKAALGGALHVTSASYWTKIQLKEDKCIFDGNEAMYAGAVIVQGEGASIELQESTFLNNKGNLGGALNIRKDARLSVAFTAKNPTVVENNSAIIGGGIVCEACRSLFFYSPVNFSANIAQEFGGAMFVKDLRGVCEIGGALFEGNVAAVGGAVALRDSAEVRIKKGVDGEDTVFKHNMALTAGALFIGSEHLTTEVYEIKDTDFDGNRALAFSAAAKETGNQALERWYKNWESALQQRNETRPQCQDCKDGRGGAIFFALRNVRSDAQVAINLEQVTLTNNAALIGGLSFATKIPFMSVNLAASLGGGYIEADRRNWDRKTSYKTCLDAINRPGSPACRGFDYHDVVVRNNRAKFAAGGLFLSSPKDLAALTLTPTTAGQEISTTGVIGSHALVLLNFVEDSEFGYGSNVATDANSLELLNVGGPLRGFASGDILDVKNARSESDLPSSDSGILIAVKDMLNQTITAGAEDADIPVMLESPWIAGKREYRAVHGVIHINQTRVIGANISAEVVVKTEDDKTISTSLEFSTLPCQEGEVMDRAQSRCFRCRHDMYTFGGRESCHACEDHAFCAGTRALVPENGYWHSTPFSPIIRRCLLKKACSFEGRREQLFAFYDDSAAVDRALESFESANDSNQTDWSELYMQCAHGYKGVLCGSCAAGYGHLANKECSECSHSVPVTRFITVMTAFLLFLIVTVRLALAIDGLRKDISFLLSEQRMTLRMKEEVTCPEAKDSSQGTNDGENPDQAPDATAVIAGPSASDPRRDEYSVQFEQPNDYRNAEAAVSAEQEAQQGTQGPGGHAPVPNSTLVSMEDTDTGPSAIEEITPEENSHPDVGATSETQSHPSESLEPSTRTREVQNRGLLPAPSDLVSPESRNASGVLAETFNILFNYIQLNSVAITLDVRWSSAFTFLSIQSSLGRVSESVPLDCNFDDRENDSGMPNAIIVLWYKIAFPLMTIGVYLFFINIYSIARRETDRAHYKFRFIPPAVLIFLVVYLSYCIDIFSGLLRAARCVHFASSEGSSHVYAHYDTLESKSTWVEDTAITCWEGEHFWSAFVATIGLVICCAVVGFMIIVLRKGRKENKLEDSNFLLRYGFLYLKYRQEGFALYWESMITVRRMLLASIEVYAHYRVTTNSQIGLLAIIIFTFITLHEIVQPFDTTNFEDTFPSYAGSTLRFCGAPRWAERWVHFNQQINLNTLEGASLFMSLSLFLAAMSINGEEGDVAESKLLLSVCVLLNALFFLFMLHRLWFGIHHSLDVAADVRNLSFLRRRHSEEEQNKFLFVKAWRMLKEKVREW